MKSFIIILAIAISQNLIAQTPESLLAEGKKLEQRYKDSAAFEVYKQVILIQPTNLKGLVKCAELSCTLGSNQKDILKKRSFYEEAKKYADKAIKLNVKDAETNYIMAVCYGKMLEIEKNKEKVVDYIKQAKIYGDAAVVADKNFGKAWHLLGKWHYELITLSDFKKAAIKVFFGGLPYTNIDTAIAYMEKCKTLEPYYCINFLDLAKAYNYRQRFEKAIANLQQLAKLPTRKADDKNYKTEGAALLQKLQ